MLTREERERAVDTLSTAELDEVYAVLKEVLPDWDADEDDDPLIDMPMIAKLAGVAPGTPGAWQQRTREGKERVAFPDPADTRYADKPQWRAVSQIVVGFLIPSRRWPRGAVAREQTRADAVPRMTLAELRRVDRELARQLRALGHRDQRARTLQGWRSLRTRRAGQQTPAA